MKGQITLDAMMYLVLALMFLGALMPTLVSGISTLTGYNIDNPIALGFIIMIIPTMIYTLIKSLMNYSEMRQ